MMTSGSWFSHLIGTPSGAQIAWAFDPFATDVVDLFLVSEVLSVAIGNAASPMLPRYPFGIVTVTPTRSRTGSEFANQIPG